MILFVDTDSPTASAAANRDAAPKRLREWLAGLGSYAGLVQVVLSSPWAANCSCDQLQAEFSKNAPPIEGVLWADTPPLSLARYDHILYWLTRRYVWRLPSWLAVQSDDADWPDDRRGKLVLADAAGIPGQAAATLRTRLEGRYWWDLWWGEGPPPDTATLSRAHALMVAWSVARFRWTTVLGRTASDAALRLDLLLTIHAGAQHRVRSGEWFPHWVHLPHAGLQMRRPIELLEIEGQEGITQVLDHVWRESDGQSLRVG